MLQAPLGRRSVCVAWRTFESSTKTKKANCIFRASSLFAKTDDTIFKRLVVVEGSRLTALHAEIEKKRRETRKSNPLRRVSFQEP